MAQGSAKGRLEFLTNFERLTANWNLAESRIKAMAGEYETIWKEIGATRFAQAVNRIIHEGKYSYFPTCGEFRGYIPTNPDGRTWWRDKNCPDCQGNGWKTVNIRESDGMHEVARCNRPGCLQFA